MQKKIEPIKTDFEKNYWDTAYKNPEVMDGVNNATTHSNYIKTTFDLQNIEITSCIDLGFGPGVIFNEFQKISKLKYACGIEPSKYAFFQYKKKYPIINKNTLLLNTSINNWCKKAPNNFTYFDLGICTSVFQYISDQDLKKIVPILSRRLKYLYLTVPTHLELTRQVRDFNFFDPYAIKRPKHFYFKLLTQHFTFISFRLLESKYYFDAQNTHFSDLLYRF